MTDVKATIVERSVDAQFLYARISKMQIDEVVTYAELSEIISRNIQGEKARGFLQTARRMAQREDGIVTDCITNVGIKRLNDDAIVDTGAHARKGMRRASMRAMKKLRHVDFENLTSDDVKRKFTTEMSFHATMHHLTEPRKIEAMARTVASSSNGLPTAETIKLLG